MGVIEMADRQNAQKCVGLSTRVSESTGDAYSDKTSTATTITLISSLVRENLWTYNIIYQHNYMDINTDQNALPRPCMHGIKTEIDTSPCIYIYIIARLGGQ